MTIRIMIMKEKKTVEFVGSIIGAIIGLVIVNTVPLWLHQTKGVILESWVNILWAANLSLIAQIIGNIILALYHPARLYSFIQAVLTAAGLVSLIVFYNVFPLDFSHLIGSWLNFLLRVVLIIAMFGTAVGIIIYLVRALAGTPYTTARNK
jgi:hypothetical protein